MANDVKQVRMALARAIAEHKVPDKVINEIAQDLASLKHQIRGIDVCERGICIDFIVEGDNWQRSLGQLTEVKGARLRGLRLFPWGIIDPDILHIRVEHEFEEMPQVRG